MTCFRFNSIFFLPDFNKWFLKLFSHFASKCNYLVSAHAKSRFLTLVIIINYLVVHHKAFYSSMVMNYSVTTLKLIGKAVMRARNGSLDSQVSGSLMGYKKTTGYFLFFFTNME